MSRSKYAKASEGRRVAYEKRKATYTEVSGVKMDRIQASFQWAGDIRLHLLNEDKECLIGLYVWPPVSGKEYYASASTGLLFDKQTGRCVQSTQVSLLIDTLRPPKGKGTAYFNKWLKARVADEGWLKSNKRGPKPKGYKAPEEGDGDASDE